MDYQTYRTEGEALRAIESMAGWPDARPALLYLPDDPNADDEGNAWVILCGKRGEDAPALRRDGCVR